MGLKKAIMLGAVLTVTSLPLIANADLTINNKTNTDSAVMISGVCSGVLGLDTPAGQSRTYNMGEIKGLCGSFPCSAAIYTTKYCTGGTQIGSATINSSLVVTGGSVSAPYTLAGVGSNNVTLGG